MRAATAVPTPPNVQKLKSAETERAWELRRQVLLTLALPPWHRSAAEVELLARYVRGWSFFQHLPVSMRPEVLQLCRVAVLEADEEGAADLDDAARRAVSVARRRAPVSAAS